MEQKQTSVEPNKKALRAARSWIGRFIRDMYPESEDQQFGFVHDAALDIDGVRLLVRFPGENTSRRVALTPTIDGHYLYPKDIKARYRPPSEADLVHLRELGKRKAN